MEKLDLAYHNDGKGKWQSHGVFILNPYKNNLDVNYEEYNIDFTSIHGYGEDKEEALENFKQEFLNKFNKLEEIKNKIINDEINFINVDCFGVII